LTAERNLLIIVKMLVMKHQHTEEIHASMNSADLFFCKPTRKVNT